MNLNICCIIRLCDYLCSSARNVVLATIVRWIVGFAPIVVLWIAGSKRVTYLSVNSTLIRYPKTIGIWILFIIFIQDVNYSLCRIQRMKELINIIVDDKG